MCFQLLILEIITASLKIPSCKNYLVAKFGLLSWLDQIIQVSSDFNQHFQSCLVQIFQSLMKNSGNVTFPISLLLNKLRGKTDDHRSIEMFEDQVGHFVASP